MMSAGLAVAQTSTPVRRAPSFSLPDSTFKQYDILDYRGRWLLLDFMKTDCPHCKALSAKLEKIKAQYPAKVAVLSIVVPPENLNTVARYIAENKVTSPILFDSSQVTASYFNITPATKNAGFDTPHLFVVDPKGMIARSWGQAFLDGPDWQTEIAQLIGNKK
jgi:peroxiredoxin